MFNRHSWQRQWGLDKTRPFPSEGDACNIHVNYFVRSDNGLSREANSLNYLLTVSCTLMLVYLNG
jgi:hypothetical protein